MRTRTILHAFLILALTGGVSAARALTQDELVARIKAAGYTDVSDIKSTAEGTTVRANKNGKQVRLVVDSSGQIKERN
ncbi:PepSY domain-containing protein [Bradyrhizobium sp. WSM1743]|uniref:PepSY domain-containing protein n=1 Tax=Bradyrhizobium sp. WSM1743 TaxID=318996 RepID=UPI0004292564|nr:PepSY domain-containing protein [Bradyrhizobium sp. WSM1743]